MKAEVGSTLSPHGITWVSRTRATLDGLAIAFLIAFILLWSFPEAPPAVVWTLDVVTWLVWGGFVIDYFVRLTCSKPHAVFIRSHKLDLLMVVLPMLRLLRVFLLLRKSLRNVSTERIASSIVSVVVFVVLASAFLVWRVEYNAPGASITTFREAIWWAVVTTTTVGYGDYTPVTAQGRAIAIVVMIVGIGLIGTVSATAAAWFVSRRKPAPPLGADAGDGEPTIHDELIARLDALSAQQVEIRAMLDRLVKGG